MNNDTKIEDGDLRRLAPNPELVEKIRTVMLETYPNVEISFICVMSLGPVWFSLLVWFTLRCCLRFRWSPNGQVARGNRYGNQYGY